MSDAQNGLLFTDTLEETELSPGNRPLIAPAICALQVMLLLGNPENAPSNKVRHQL